MRMIALLLDRNSGAILQYRRRAIHVSRFNAL